MCLSTVYENTLDDSKILMSNVAKIEIEDNLVVLTDLMERKLEIDGELVFVDLLSSKAIVKERV
ncbi:MAG: CooT family nickel-binding protein [Oscillospiraceae bacterium]|nr:CooT family nickel-binding protein [Candidatus Limimonas coprohippi]MCQ2487955.1 CooT family nickel-binding protein [Clostridia bacterium]